MGITVVDGSDRGLALLQQVIQLGDRYRDTLGFLPRQAFIDRAAAGTILAVEGSSGTVLAYALYDLPGNAIRLVHLCIAEDARGRGLARQLLQELEARHGDRRHIRLRCRRDFPAHHMWPKLGFKPVGEAPGRSAEGHLLTLWHKPLQELPSLFDLDVDSVSTQFIVAMDANVFLDLTEERPTSPESSVLREGWVAREIEVVYTDEVVRELDGHEDPERRRRSRDALVQFRRLRAAQRTGDRVYERLLVALGH